MQGIMIRLLIVLCIAFSVVWMMADETPDAGAALGFFDQSLELIEAQDWQGLLAHSRRWTEIEPRNASAWFYLGLAYNILGRHDESIDAYREALQIQPEYDDTWYNLGYNYNERVGRAHD